MIPKCSVSSSNVDGVGVGGRVHKNKELSHTNGEWQVAKRRYPTFKVRDGGWTLLEQPVKRYSTSKIRETQVRR